MKYIFLSMLMLAVSAVFAVTDSDGGGMDSGGGNTFRISEKTITKYIESDLKSNVVLTLQALEKIYKTETRVPYSTTIKHDADRLKALATLFDGNNLSRVIADVETSKYEIMRTSCFNSNQQEVMSSTNYGEHGGTVCLSLPLIQKTTLRYENLAYENALVALLIHEHLHHFQKSSERENEIAGEIIQSLVLLVQEEAKSFYSNMGSSKKIAQVLFEKMSKSIDIRSRRFASLHVNDSDQVFVNVKLKWKEGSRCMGRPFDPDNFHKPYLYTTRFSSTLGRVKMYIDGMQLNIGESEFTIEIPTHNILERDLLVVGFDQGSIYNECRYENMYSITVVQNNKIISQRDEMPVFEGDPSLEYEALLANYNLYLY